jgi:hypothetical protein
MGDTDLILFFEICQSSNCKTIDFTDTTSIFTTEHTTGWGGTNYEIVDVLTAILYITLPDGTTVSINMIPLGFPNIIPTYSTTLTSYQLGLSSIGSLTSLPDGIYNFKYIVTVDSGTPGAPYTIQTDKTVVLTCGIKCAIDQLLSGLVTCNCNCKEDGKLDDALLAYMFYQNLLNAAKCASSSIKINNLLDTLTTLLNITNSDCGCLGNGVSTNTLRY